MKTITTWHQVGIPSFFINKIKKLDVRNSNILECFINDRVFHLQKKYFYIYTCSACAHTYKTYKDNENYLICKSCKSPMVSMKKSLVWPVNKRYINTGNISQLICKMKDNYLVYYGKQDQFFSFNFSLEYEEFYSKFLYGEVIRSKNPTVAIAKSAILTPFLWDTRYNWESNTKSNCEVQHIQPLFSLLYDGLTDNIKEI